MLFSLYCAGSLDLHRECRLMPVVQEIPFQKHDQKEEAETQYRGRQHQRKQIVRLELRRRIQDGVAQTSSTHAARTGVELTRDCADHRNAAGDSDSHEERWHRVRQAQVDEELRGSSIVHQEEMNQVL